MTARIGIRHAIPGDEPILAQLNAMVQALHVGARPDVFVSVAESDLAAWFAGILGKSTHRAWLAEIDGTPAGYLLAVAYERPATPFSVARRWLEIDQLGVAETLRERGVARLLVDAAIDWARELGMSHVSAQCWAFNTAAQAVFSRLGFTPMAVRLERNLDDEAHASG